MSRTIVRVGDDYDVVIGEDAWADLPGLVGERAERVLLVRAPSLPGPADAVRTALEAAGLEVVDAEVPDAERAKTADVAAGLWSLLGRRGFTRTDVVVGLGGGATTDLAGFVAATWLRGVPVVQVPTTLLGMVDAAVGGKTGINTPEGKNLVGAFHPPAGVLADLWTLRTLPRADLVAGLAEVIKCGFIADPRILELVEADPSAALDVDGPVLRELVERAVAVKAEVVSQDLRESSLREILNYGHTFGHAIEQVEAYTWRHGEAVSVGMVYVAELGAAAGVLDRGVVERHREVLRSVGLPTSYDGGSWEALLTAMRRDKKSRGSLLRFVVLESVARPTRLEGPTGAQLRSAFEAVRAQR
ncbi:3-dehydroquinate synthase [Luteipulveratus flavus]|uniref:3-dehydroquinate synthase n=1 Tax=Luteipulveratus flavus TaxID=3031728 RepID=A0ABT6C758_9MICO|nr:3-dehydroquinate synthase [Luteipulveratus sp. YIM 133296]MDF8264167.1 3-dehydroquinate synthase [Luteipulveratus sp. YIM 133296]